MLPAARDSLAKTSVSRNLQPNLSSNQPAVKMGRVRTKTVKKSAKVIIERYYPKLTLDFETNKRVCDEIAIIASKRLRNKVRLPLPRFAYFGEEKRKTDRC